LWMTPWITVWALLGRWGCGEGVHANPIAAPAFGRVVHRVSHSTSGVTGVTGEREVFLDKSDSNVSNQRLDRWRMRVVSSLT